MPLVSQRQVLQCRALSLVAAAGGASAILKPMPVEVPPISDSARSGGPLGFGSRRATHVAGFRACAFCLTSKIRRRYGSSDISLVHSPSGQAREMLVRMSPCLSPLDEQKQISPLAWQADAAVCWSSRRTPQKVGVAIRLGACRWPDRGPFYARETSRPVPCQRAALEV